LLKDGALEVEIDMSLAAGAVDCILVWILCDEGFGTGRVDLIAAPTNARTDGSDHRVRLHAKFLTHEFDGSGDNLCCGALSPRMDNANGG
jgi:hypothetical protein